MKNLAKQEKLNSIEDTFNTLFDYHSLFWDDPIIIVFLNDNRFHVNISMAFGVLFTSQKAIYSTLFERTYLIELPKKEISIQTTGKIVKDFKINAHKQISLNQIINELVGNVPLPSIVADNHQNHISTNIYNNIQLL
jgi:hypothetical protein